MRIAYVEDNAINLALVQRIATMSGHVITSYTEGETALVALSQQTFDLIMMDVELAGELNGLQVVRALRARGLTTPIVAVTAYAMMGDREKCLEAGCNDYLPKPLPIAEFLTLLAHYDNLIKEKQTTPPSADVPKPKVKQTGPLVEPAPLLVTVTETPAPVLETVTPAPTTDSAKDQSVPSLTIKAAEPATVIAVTDRGAIEPIAANGNGAVIDTEVKVESIAVTPLQTPAAPEAPTSNVP
jgi:CheY-like chemotaxis protein